MASCAWPSLEPAFLLGEPLIEILLCFDLYPSLHAVVSQTTEFRTGDLEGVALDRPELDLRRKAWDEILLYAEQRHCEAV